MSEDRRLAATITFITNKIDFFPHMKPILADYLSKLITCFEKHFQNDDPVKFLWIQDPFNVTSPSGFTAAKEDNLTELSFDNSWDVSLSEHLLPKKQPPAKFQVSSPTGLGDFAMITQTGIPGSKPDSAEDRHVWGLLHVKSYVVAKRLPVGVAWKFGKGVPAQVSSSSSDRGSKLRGPSQNSPRVAAKRDVNITKLN
ncbi:hypothetical protein AVEN_190989-1 [Araneus ventricosus]|uniref:Uncharacterized protein n=1 Tax=Araneus ventricosus TaxID=182803 RepID=A0A4Y2NZV1_ARAVE|nr:hypothetical protein AVEN_4882-1 [Araneus ventricosus]GBN44614.1 hypothetical protein AVEN_190989-1 [Araneus ventricosus]